MNGFPADSKRREQVVVCALETYSKIGGLQNFNRRVFQSLAARAVSAKQPNPVVLLSGDDPASIPPTPGIELVAIQGRAAFLFKPIWCAVRRADVLILCHVKLAIIAPFVRLLRPKLPILLFVHGIEAWSKPALPSLHFFDAWCLRAVTCVASVSEFTAAAMSPVFGVPPAKFRLLPNAVDLPKANPDPAKRESATILCVNRISLLDRKKNVDLLIKAVAKLKDKLPDLKLDIVGDGELRPELEALAQELGVSDFVRFHGRISEEALSDAYARASVFAMPSSKEGFGIVYLEAWLRGLPVICSTEGASSEVVSDGVDGFVVDPADVTMIADRLRLLLTQPELARAMGEKGRQKVMGTYLDGNFRANLNMILDELTKDDRRGQTLVKLQNAAE